MPHPAINGRLHRTVLQSRRKTVYRMMKKRHSIVPCFVCGKPVLEQYATLEHITPLSKGGTDEISNLSISHAWCNHARGNGD